MRARPLAFTLALSACGPPSPSARNPPGTGAEALGRAPTCDAVDDDEGRLVVDWSPLDRAKLEAAARRGAVPMRVEGCRARLVDTCTVKRSYAFLGTTRQREVIVLRDRDEIGAALPVLGARLGASFAHASSVDVAMTVIGRYELGARAVAASELEGDCERVTHVVASVSVGAFAISTGAATALGLAADVAHAGHSTERRRLDAAGNDEDCAHARRSDDAPPQDCGIPLRVELRGIAATAPPPKVAAPAPLTENEALRRSMANARKEIVPCHRTARATSPDLSGVLTLGVKLGPRGNVRSVVAKHEGNLDDSLADCAAARVALVSFPPAEDDRPRALVIPVLFAPLAR